MEKAVSKAAKEVSTMCGSAESVAARSWARRAFTKSSKGAARALLELIADIQRLTSGLRYRYLLQRCLAMTGQGSIGGMEKFWCWGLGGLGPRFYCKI